MISSRVPTELPTDRIAQQAAGTYTTTPPTEPQPQPILPLPEELELLVHGKTLRIPCR